MLFCQKNDVLLGLQLFLELFENITLSNFSENHLVGALRVEKMSTSSSDHVVNPKKN